MAKIFSFLPYSAPTPFSNKTHHRLSVSSKINASNSNNYPLASKIIVKIILLNKSSSSFRARLDKGPRELEYVKLPDMSFGMCCSERFSKLDIILFAHHYFYALLNPHRIILFYLITDLSFSTSQSHLVSEFSKYGQIAEVRLVEDKATKKPKGYAFIQYTSQEEAMLALESMDDQFFDGRTLFVDIAKPMKSDFGDYPKASGPPQERLVTEGANDD
ncbi:RNA binding protein [Striga asiatica]|uniref:RNA binding protein n=1 Tax=Striga asiatica TaxID=4170 RepID=A0A5A7QYA5_STRAF|nr:RNA binding protein [Striga asiatica]